MNEFKMNRVKPSPGPWVLEVEINRVLAENRGTNPTTKEPFKTDKTWIETLKVRDTEHNVVFRQECPGCGWGYNVSMQKALANARLIAAAPLLQKALIDVLRYGSDAIQPRANAIDALDASTGKGAEWKQPSYNNRGYQTWRPTDAGATLIP